MDGHSGPTGTLKGAHGKPTHAMSAVGIPFLQSVQNACLRIKVEW